MSVRLDFELDNFFSQLNKKFGAKLLFRRTESSGINRRQEIQNIRENLRSHVMIISSLVKLPIILIDSQIISLIVSENASDRECD